MNNIKRKPLHDRKIVIKGYLRDDGLYDIEGELLDTKHYSVKNFERGEIKSGEAIHNMKVKITLDENLTIKDASAETLYSPFSICKSANKSFSKIIGCQIKSGWRKKVLMLIGGINGCTHISELLGPLATTAFQTIHSHSNKKNRKKDNIISKKPPLLGTCHAFNPKSEVVKRLWPNWFNTE